MDIHAGGFETSLVAAFFPELVDMDLVKTLEPTDLTFRDAGKWVEDARRVTPLGYVGDPASYDAEAGKRYVEDQCRMIADAIEDLIKKK